jgi:hypothetical protein
VELRVLPVQRVLGLGEHRLQHRQVLIGRPLGRLAGKGGLDRKARVQQLDHGAGIDLDVVRIGDHQPLRHLADIDPGAMADIDHAKRLQPAHRLAEGGRGHGELRRQLAHRRQPVPRLQVPGLDQVQHPPHQLLREVRAPLVYHHMLPGPIRRHGGCSGHVMPKDLSLAASVAPG